MSDHQTTNRYWRILVTAAAGVCFGTGIFGTFVSAFGLDYSWSNWNQGGFVPGMLKTVNDVADRLGTSCYIIIQKHEGAGEEAGLFLTAVLILSILAAMLVVISRNLWLYLLYVVPAVILIAGLTLTPDAIWPVMVCISLMLSIMLNNLEERIDWRSLLLPVFAGTLAAVLALTPAGALFQKGSPGDDMSSRLRDKVRELRYGTNPLGDGSLDRDERGKTERGDDVALTVTMEKPRAMYLRGFVGEKRGRSGWEDLGNQTHYESRDLLTALREKGMDPLGQIVSSAKAAGMGLSPSEVTIEVGKASSKYIYTPYEITGNMPEDSRDHSGSFTTAGGLRGLRTYGFQTTEDLAGQWTDVAGKLFSRGFSGDTEKLAISESHYNRFVYENYTDLSDSDVGMLLDAVGTRGNQEEGHVGYKTAISKVKAYLEGKVVYTDRVDTRKDPVRVLFENNKGNDTAYASAATLMFRYYGIPARYVEGYLLTDEEAKKMKAGEARDIPLSQEHAWTEIYVDGVGFVPLETCSKYYGVMPEADLNKGLESRNTNNPFEQPETASRSRELKEEEPPESRSIPWIRIIYLVLLALQILFLLWMIYLGIGKLRGHIRKNRAFRHPDPGRGIMAMYGYAVEEGLTMAPPAVELGREASYSSHTFTEEQRNFMKEAYTNARKRSN